jgi:hypothetical protein
VTRIQVHFPDELYRRARRLAEVKGIPVVQLIRRGLELVLDQYPEPEGVQSTWRAPVVKGLGWRGLSHEELQQAAQLDS